MVDFDGEVVADGRQRGTPLTRTLLTDVRKFLFAPHCILRRLDLQESYLQSAGAAWVSLTAQLREVSASAAGHGAAQDSDVGNVEVRGLAWRNRDEGDRTGSFASLRASSSQFHFLLGLNSCGTDPAKRYDCVFE